VPWHSPHTVNGVGALSRCPDQLFPRAPESPISLQENSQELLSQLSPAIASLAAEVGLTPIPVRGKSQCGFSVTINGDSMTLWVGHYPGFCPVKGVDYQVALSTDSKAIRWGVTRENAVRFLQTGLIADGHPVARKGKDLKALRKG